MCPRDIDQHTRHRQSTAEAIDARVICRVDDRGVTRALIGEQSFDEAQRAANVAGLRVRLAQADFDAATAAGRALSLDAAIEKALGQVESYPPLVNSFVGLKGSY